ncbi:MAG TPA: ERAP1-like C-terminal domain-containing protein, partial [Actinomycetota bacterium]|nr:ERAP1-like C-terminal domain-containing protein [Actinomycetota bacterium]
ERTEVIELAGARVPALLLPNDRDLTFAKVRFDERSLATIETHLGGLPESLSRAVVWSALWDMARDAELPAGRYLRIIHAHASRESHVGVLESVLGHAASLIDLLGDPSRRISRGEGFAALALERLRAAEPGSDAQLAWARAFIGAARSADQLADVRGLLDGTESVEGLEVDIDLRWHIVRSLAAAGAADEELIAAEERRDPTDEGARNAAAARAAQPEPAAKEAAWARAFDAAASFSEVVDVLAGFQRAGQEELLRPYRERYFETLGEVWAERDIQVALMLGVRAYPHNVVEPETMAATEAYLARGDVPGPVRRLLLEAKDGVARALRTRAADRG